MRREDQIIFEMYQENIFKKAAPIAAGAAMLAGAPMKAQDQEGSADTEKYVYAALPEKDKLSYDISRQTNYQNVMFSVVETVQKLLSNEIDNNLAKQELMKTLGTENDDATLERINSMKMDAPQSTQNILNWILKTVFDQTRS